MNDDENIERMVDLLKSGSTMLEYTCPVCSSPLFKIKGDIWCPKCNKRVIISSEGDVSAPSSLLLSDIEKIILLKIEENCQQITKETDIAKLEKLSGLLVKWLEVLERTRRIQKL